MRGLMTRFAAFLVLLTFAATPIAAQVDPSARGLAVQARTLAIGRDARLVTGNGDSREAAVYIDAGQQALNMRSPLVWARELMGARFTIGKTFGVSGDRTDQMLARMPAVIATRAGIFHLWAGVNDIAQNYPTATTSGATAAMNIIAMSETARLAGMKVIIELEVGANGLTAAQITQVNELNARLADYAENAPNVYLNDARSAVMQPTAGTSALAFKTGFSLDGTHEISRAAYYHALTLIPLLTQLIPPRPVMVRSATSVPANGRYQLLANPIFATATGGTLSGANATGTVPSGWTGVASGGATATFGTQSDVEGIGNNVTMTCQWAASGDACRLAQTVQTADWSPGDILQATATVQVTGASACLAATRLVMGVNGYFDATLSGTNITDGYHAIGAGSVGPNETYTVTLMTRPITVPAYTSRSFVAGTLYVEGSCAGTVNVVVRQMAIRRRLSAPNG